MTFRPVFACYTVVSCLIADRYRRVGSLKVDSRTALWGRSSDYPSEVRLQPGH